MKKMIFVLCAATLLVNSIKSRNNDSGVQVAVALANNAAHVYTAVEAKERTVPSERNFRKNIYWLDVNTPHFMKLHQFKKEIPFYIPTFEDHIKVLEKKIVENKNKFTSRAMVKALFLSVLSGLFGYSSYYLYKNPGLLFSYTDKTLYAEALVSCRVMTVVFGIIALHYFNKVRTHKDRLIERLKRDKRLLAAFKKENDEISKNHVVNAALKLIDAVAAATA